MLFADLTDRHLAAVAVGKRRAEHARADEDALTVVTERPVADIGEMRLALVEPVMDREIIFRSAAEQLR